MHVHTGRCRLGAVKDDPSTLMAAADMLSFSLLPCPLSYCPSAQRDNSSPCPPDPCPCRTEEAASASWLVASLLRTAGAGHRGPSLMPWVLATDVGPAWSCGGWPLGKENDGCLTDG